MTGELARDLDLDEAAAQHHQRLLVLLRTHGYERRQITLASGRQSDFYIDCRRVVLTAEGHFLVGWLLHYALQRVCPEVTGIGGMSTGADPLVSSTALISYLAGTALDGFYVRKQAKAHGTGRTVEGATRLTPGARVAMLEDVVTSGQSVLQAAAAARSAGLQPVRVIALVDRQEGGRETIAAELPLTALFSADDIRA